MAVAKYYTVQTRAETKKNAPRQKKPYSTKEHSTEITNLFHAHKLPASPLILATMGHSRDQTINTSYKTSIGVKLSTFLGPEF